MAFPQEVVMPAKAGIQLFDHKENGFPLSRE
jgi:hypothetical protein